MAEKTKIKIGNKDYFIEDLNDEAKIQIQNILYVNNKISDLQAQINVLNAAKEYYFALLKQILPPEEEEKKEESEKIKFS